MALIDVLADSQLLSVILEFIALISVVLGFFRWYDSKYRTLVKDTKDEVIEKITTSTDRLCEKLEDLKKDFNKLEDSYYGHLSRHGDSWALGQNKQQQKRRHGTRNEDKEDDIINNNIINNTNNNGENENNNL